MSDTSQFRNQIRILSTLRQVPASQLLPKISNSLKFRIRNGLLGRLPKGFEQQFVDRAFGMPAGHRFYWRKGIRDWDTTEGRIFQIAREGTAEDMRLFVRSALHHAIGAVTPMMMARSALTADIMADILREPDFPGFLRERGEAQSDFTCGIAAAAAHLLDDRDRAPIEAVIRDLQPNPSRWYQELLGSFSTTPSVPRDASVTIPRRAAVRHRLIIADALNNPARLSLVFRDAEKVTLLSPQDLYGRAAFDEASELHSRPEEVIVSHPRSRITRFSSGYHDLHDETRVLGEELTETINREMGGYLGEAKAHFALHLADFLFFKGLCIDAIEDYLRADDVDEILIVATSDKAPEEFLKWFTGIPGLATDPRIRFVSLARTEKARAAFSRNLPIALSPRHEQTRRTHTAAARPLSECLDPMRDMIAKDVRKMNLWPSRPEMDGKPRVLYFTTPFPTYNATSAAYLDILYRNFNTLTGIVGTNVTPIFSGEHGMPPVNTIQLLPSGAQRNLPQAEYTILFHLEELAERLRREGRAATSARVLERFGPVMSYQTVLLALQNWTRMLLWYERMIKADQRPDVVVISPLRTTLPAMSTAAARHFGVPSIALEPHIMNAAYCRYTRVATDRYGTVSGYLADAAAEGFAIPRDRVDVIGSPRLMVATGATQAEARETLTRDHQVDLPQGKTIVTFFSQPSKWEQISEVWGIILDALQDHPDMHLWLKTHPEEGRKRADGYLRMAAQMGLADRVSEIQAPTPEIIRATDIALGCYSTTILEAALAERTVFAISNGAEYPLAQNEVVGAPLFCDAASLSEAFSDFLREPDHFTDMTRAFLAAESQFIEGPESRLVAVVERMASLPPQDVIRPKEDLPPRLFIEGPYTVFDI